MRPTLTPNDLTIFGYAGSTFVRTVRLTCEEKGAAYDLAPPATADEAAHHPFGRMPTMHHDGLVLFESLAIATYVDATFPGPTLRPREPSAHGQMLQWISAVNDYLYQPAVRQYAVPLNKGAQTVEQLEAVAADVESRLAVFDRAVAGPFLIGSEPTLADAFAIPVLAYLDGVPSGHEMIDGFDGLRDYLEAWSKRPSFEATR